MTDDKLTVSVSYSGALDLNGRIYPAEVMQAAMKKALREGKLDVRVDPDPVSGKSTLVPIQIGNKRFINPKFTLVSSSMNEDGSLLGSFEVEERAGVVDRLADVARDGEVSPEPSSQPEPGA